MKTWVIQTYNCPIMSRPVVVPNTVQSSYSSHYMTMHWQKCSAPHCPMWVGDNQEGRCGYVRVTDAEAMKMALT